MWAKQKRRAERCVIFRNHSLTCDPSYKGANQRIIYLHCSPACSNQNIRKKRLADIQQLGLMRGTFIRWSISKCKSLRVKHQMEMNQMISLWAEPNFPYLAGATLLRSPSLSLSQPGHTNIVENGPPHHWIKKWFRIEQKNDNSSLLYSSVQHRNISKIHEGYQAVVCSPTSPPHCACASCSPKTSPFQFGYVLVQFHYNWVKILLHFQAKCSSSHVHLEPQHEKYLICHYEKNSG